METPPDEVDLRRLYRDAQQEYQASNFRRALRLYKDLLDRGEYEMPPETLFDVREALATCCHSLGRYGDAARYNRKTLEDLEASSDYGLDHSLTVRIRYNLARALTAASKPGRASAPKLKEAVSLYKQIMGGMKAHVDPTTLKRTRISLASALFKLERYSQARDLYEQLIQEMEADAKQPGEAERLRLQHDYAGTLYHLKRYKKSKKLFLEIEHALISMSEKQRRKLGDLSQSVGRYVAACVEATDDLDMGVARSMMPVLRDNGVGSSASLRSAAAGSRSELQVTLGAKDSRSSDGAASQKRRDSRVSSRSDTPFPISRARSSSDRTDRTGANISEPASGSVLAAGSTGSASALTVSPIGWNAARRTRSDQSLGSSRKTENLDAALTSKRPTRSSFSSTPPSSSELIKNTEKPPSARRTKSDSSSIHTTSPRDKEAASNLNEILRKFKDVPEKRAPPTEIADSGLQPKPYKDRSSVQRRKSQVPKLKITAPGSWPEEASLSDNDTRSTTASSSSPQPLAIIPKRKRAPKDSGTVKAVTRNPSPETQSTGKLYALPSGANEADQWFHLLRKYSHTLLCNGVPKNPTYEPVRVAVLDSGFASASDNTDLPISDQGLRRVKRGHVTYKDFTGGDSSYTDNTKVLHGTWCASLLMQTAPNAKLYVANVVRPGKVGQKADHVAAAIAWAIANEVDIISMSFGWETEQEEVDKQIEIARSKGILLFAAASNDGDLGTGKYPASKHAVYCVYSCTGHGKTSEFNPRPPKPETCFMFPGEGITVLETNHKPTKGVQKGGQRDVERRTGTSYATPIAAGTAAMLLDLARQELKQPHVLRDVERRLKKVEGMSAVFLAMSEQPRDGGFYHVRPWELLGESKPISSKNNVDETHKWYALRNLLGLKGLRAFGPYAEDVS